MTARNYEIARFIRVAKNPDDMTRPELIEALEDLAEYASHRVTECHTLRNIIKTSIK